MRPAWFRVPALLRRFSSTCWNRDASLSQKTRCFLLSAPLIRCGFHTPCVYTSPPPPPRQLVIRRKTAPSPLFWKKNSPWESNRGVCRTPQRWQTSSLSRCGWGGRGSPLNSLALSCFLSWSIRETLRSSDPPTTQVDQSPVVGRPSPLHRSLGTCRFLCSSLVFHLSSLCCFTPHWRDFVSTRHRERRRKAVQTYQMDRSGFSRALANWLCDTEKIAKSS